MTRDELFLNTLKDLNTKINSKDEYEILMSSGLLRKLLLDSSPLVHQVNVQRKEKISFVINDSHIPSDPSLVFWSTEDGFDPETSVPHLSKSKEVNLETLLKAVVMVVNGQKIKVVDLIKFLSHVQGAIHAGKPTNLSETILQDINKYLGIGGLPAGTRLIRAIGRVVIKGLTPLKAEIES